MDTPAIYISEATAFARGNAAINAGQSFRVLPAKHYGADKTLTLGFKVLVVETRGRGARYLTEPCHV
jgi:hypothetical protein